MISEKTVELNLSMELINHINFQNNLSVFAIAPTQRQEAALGYDVEIGDKGDGNGILIQYKRAIPNGDEYLFHINYTTYENQHDVLLQAETNGLHVFYAFPMFHTIDHIIEHRRRLLTKTVWYKPSQIILPGGSIGKHTLHINRINSTTYVTSEPTPIEDPLSFVEMNQIFSSFRQNKLSKLKDIINFLNSSISNEKTDSQLIDSDEDVWSTLSQQFIISLGNSE